MEAVNDFEGPVTPVQGNATAYTSSLNSLALGSTPTAYVVSGGSATGSITQNSTKAALATLAVDANGNGSITYPAGTTATIMDYFIQG